MHILHQESIGTVQSNSDSTIYSRGDCKYEELAGYRFACDVLLALLVAWRCFSGFLTFAFGCTSLWGAGSRVSTFGPRHWINRRPLMHWGDPSQNQVAAQGSRPMILGCYGCPDPQASCRRTCFGPNEMGSQINRDLRQTLFAGANPFTLVT